MGKKYEIEGRIFEEAGVANQLMLFSDGCSLIQVNFDLLNEPHLKYIDGAVYWAGLPTSVKNELVRRIKEEYPDGFKKEKSCRVKKDSLLKSAISIINDHEKFEIIDWTESGRLNVENEEYTKFNGIARVEGHDESIVILVQPAREKVAVLKKFFHHFSEDDANVSLLSMVNARMLGKDELIQRDGCLPKERITYFQEFAILNEYEFAMFNQKRKLKSMQVYAKNPVGWVEYCEYGAFLIFQSIEYN